MRNTFILLVFFASISSGACTRDDQPAKPATTAPTVGATVADRPDRVSAPAPAAEHQGGAPAPLPPAVEEALRDVRDKRRCNRVMGCPPIDALVRAGVVSVNPMVDLLRTTRGDAPWRTELVRALGTIGHRDALPLLRELVSDPLWLMRTEAAVALGRLHDAESVPALERLLAGSTDPDHAAEHAAAGYALARLGQAEVGHAAVLRTLTPEAVARNNWGFTTIAVDLARELALREALPGIRAAAGHQDVFLRKAAFAALAQLRDGGANRALVDALGDHIPSVRSAARDALEAITGEKRTDAAWRTWCDAGCGEDAAPTPTPEGGR